MITIIKTLLRLYVYFGCAISVMGAGFWRSSFFKASEATRICAVGCYAVLDNKMERKYEKNVTALLEACERAPKQSGMDSATSALAPSNAQAYNPPPSPAVSFVDVDGSIDPLATEETQL